jgi:uncharacterized protein
MSDERSCGECSLCCRLLKVPELQKPEHKMCVHFKKGIGCEIHNGTMFPDSCREFMCVWRDPRSTLPLELRPDKVHAVMLPAGDREHPAIGVIIDPHRPDAIKREPLKSFLDAVARSGLKVYVVRISDQRMRHYRKLEEAIIDAT